MAVKYGVVLGAWLVAHVVAYRLLVRSGWPVGDDAPADIRVDIFDGLSPRVQLLVTVLAFVIPAVVVPIWRWFERVAGIDGAVVASATVWCRTVLLRPASVAVVVTVTVLLVLPAFDDRLIVAAAPAIALTLLLPLAVFTPAVVSSPAGERWWLPRWPGVGPISAFVLVTGLAFGIGAMLDAIAGSSLLLAAAAVVVGAVLSVLAIALGGSVLLLRLTVAETVKRLPDLLSWRRVGPLVAVYARLLFVAMFFYVPVITGALIL